MGMCGVFRGNEKGDEEPDKLEHELIGGGEEVGLL